MSTTPQSDLMSRSEAAVYLGLREQTLACWATNKRYDLPYVKCGRRVYYRRTHLEAWLASRTVNSTGALDHRD
ncbi:MAG: helix-turn-helix domain-containing protein [Rhodopirellula sp.]|nr:helix-turn-helix domain-containing protein [Rhodopirellula sp.]